MKLLIIAVAIIVLIKILEIVLRKEKKEGNETNAYYKKKYFLTKAEYNFLGILQQILKDEYYIFPQVHLASILGVKKGTGNWQGLMNKINRKSVDFVIFDKQYIQPLLAIELDDSSHRFSKRQERDKFVDKIMQSASMDILHVRASGSYNVDELSNIIFDKLGR